VVLVVLFQLGLRREIARLRHRQLVAEDDGELLAAPHLLTGLGRDAHETAADQRQDRRRTVSVGLHDARRRLLQSLGRELLAHGLDL
jgi:hypothetical protein